MIRTGSLCKQNTLELPGLCFFIITSFHFQHGYTFLAEARTTLSSLAPGKFRLRVIGSTEPLPAPEGDSVNAQFVTKEIKDYYMPNKDRILLRYAVNALYHR
jgi:hypothetical protein